MFFVKRVVFILFFLAMSFVAISQNYIILGDTTVKIVRDFKPDTVRQQTFSDVFFKNTDRLKEKFFLVIFLLVLTHAFLYLFYRDNFSVIEKVLFNKNRFVSFLQERSAAFQTMLNLFSFLFVLDLSVILWFLLLQFRGNEIFFNLGVLFVIFLVLAFWSLIKRIVLLALSYVLDLYRFSDIFLTRKKIFHSFSSLFLVVLIAVIPFTAYPKHLLIGVITLLFLSYFFQIFPLFFAVNKKDFPLFWFILYLCSVEILPFFIGLKLFYRYFG